MDGRNEVLFVTARFTQFRSAGLRLDGLRIECMGLLSDLSVGNHELLLAPPPNEGSDNPAPTPSSRNMDLGATNWLTPARVHNTSTTIKVIPWLCPVTSHDFRRLSHITNDRPGNGVAFEAEATKLADVDYKAKLRSGVGEAAKSVLFVSQWVASTGNPLRDKFTVL